MNFNYGNDIFWRLVARVYGCMLMFVGAVLAACFLAFVLAHTIDYLIHSSSQGREENHTDCDTHTALPIRIARLSTPVVASHVRAQKAPSAGSVASSCW